MNLSSVARLMRIMVAVGAIIGVTACDLVGDLGPGPDSEDRGPASVVSRTLQELPQIEAQLPASLSGETSGVSASIGAAALGDVTELTPSAMPDVRSQAWYDMRDAAGLDYFTEAFIDELREVASERNLGFNTVHSLGTREFFGEMFDMGHLKVTGSENDMTVYWFLRPGPGSRFWTRLHIVRSGDDWRVTAVTNMVDDASSTWGEGTMSSYATFNTATGESLLIMDELYIDPDYGTESYQDITMTTPNTDGSLTLLSAYSSGDGWGKTRIGWGDDRMGGVLSIDTDGADGYASRDFYDGNGNLLKESWGSATPRGGFFWVESNGLNLKTAGLASAPPSVYVFSVWDYTAGISTRYVSEDDSLDTGSDPVLTGYDVYYKKGTNWAEGDAIYYWNNSSEYDDSDPNTWVWQEEYTIGYQVPPAQSIFGSAYYLEDRYPLKQLLPLMGSYADRSVNRVEGETYTSTWNDEDDVEHDWSWTEYQYFIDVNGNNIFDEDGQNPDVRLDNVWMKEFWIWDHETYEETKVKAPVVTASAGSLPSYFAFSSANQTIVDTVEARITDIYNNEFSALSFEDHRHHLEDLRDQPEFDDVEF